jgi:ATP synthase protein I
MTDPSRQERFHNTVERKARRKRREQARNSQPLWSGFSLFGIVGWSVAVPTLLAIAVGIWLDRHIVGGPSWTLTLLPVGIVLGCLSAWRWISHEEQQIHHHPEDPQEDDDDQ